MKITKIRIQNFRSFGEKIVEINLSQGTGYFVVVGPNASGKTNLLESIRWVMLDRIIGGDYIDPWDFHRGQTQNPILIELEIEPPLKHGDTFNKFTDIGLLRLEAKEYKIGEEKGSIRCDQPALTKDKKPILTNQTIPLAKTKTLNEEEKEAKQNARPLMVRDIKDRLPVYYLDNASYGFHLSMRQGSLMSRLSRILHDDLMRDENKITWQGQEQTRSEAISKILIELGNILKTARSEEILGAMGDFMAEQLQIPRNSLDLKIGLPQGQELLRKMELLGKDCSSMPEIPFERLGRGYTALGIVALFRALNKLGNEHQGAIILIEEPELFLGPHLRSLFADTLQKFAQKGNQVIVVTHSVEFLDPFSPLSAILVKKENDATISFQWPIDETVPSFDISLKHIEPNLNKLLFSKRVLFVEGDDDYAAISAILELLNISPAYIGLEILRLGGFGNAKHLVTYAKKFGITYASLLDANAKAILETIDSSGTTWRLFDPDLEGALNTSKASENSIHVSNIVKSSKTWDDLKKKYPKFTTAIGETCKILGIEIKD